MKTRLVVRTWGMTTSSNLVCDVQHMGDSFSLVLHVKPVPASRPRVGRWGTYYGKTYKTYREAAEGAIPLSSEPPLTGTLGCTVVFVCHRPKTTKRITPVGDLDNHLKAILDAIVGHPQRPKGYIGDDDQITHIDATKRWVTEGEEPHTLVTIGKI
jgi:Holliday junction resolvase RusA-like endonuclease